MDLRRTLLLFSFIFTGSLAIAQPKDRWTIQDGGAIRWSINDNIPHDDHLEMSGQQLSVVLRYGVDAQKRFEPQSCFSYASHASQQDTEQSEATLRCEYSRFSYSGRSNSAE